MIEHIHFLGRGCIIIIETDTPVLNSKFSNSLILIRSENINMYKSYHFYVFFSFSLLDLDYPETSASSSSSIRNIDTSEDEDPRTSQYNKHTSLFVHPELIKNRDNFIKEVI